MRVYYVYILASRSRVLYIGVTRDLQQRLAQHRSFTNPRSFTARYDVTKLVYSEEYTYVNDAIARETQLKTWRRAKKVELIEAENPNWEDLAPPIPRIPRSRSA
jgi:putative endonuclease